MLLVSCSNDSNDSNDSSNSNETIKGKLKVTKIERTTTSSGKVKDEYIEQYFYDNSKLTSIKNENTISSGVVSNGSSITIANYFYDNTGKLIKITDSEPSYDNTFKNVYVYEYFYNEKGQITESNKNIVASGRISITNYYYDDLGRLIKKTNPDFIYGPQTYSYYGSSFNIKPSLSGATYDNSINVFRFLCPTKAYADAEPYSVNNLVGNVNIHKHDSQNRLIKIIYPADLNNNNYETIYEYVD